MERFVAVLIEHTVGKFPLWLTPEQVIVLPISEKFNDYAQKVSDILCDADIRCDVDLRNEKIDRKIRDNELKRIPYLLVVGEKEAETESVSVRRQGHGDQGTMSVDEFSQFILNEVKEMQSKALNLKK
jgi:threonyl-tRNA synthetase